MLSVSETAVPATGTVTSLYLVGSGLGAMALPWAIGALLEAQGAVALPAVALAGVTAAAGTAIAFVLRARSLVSR
jgi:hypothetical protein